MLPLEHTTWSLTNYQGLERTFLPDWDITRAPTTTSLEQTKSEIDGQNDKDAQASNLHPQPAFGTVIALSKVEEAILSAWLHAAPPACKINHRASVVTNMMVKAWKGMRET